MKKKSNNQYSSFWGIMIIAGTVIGGGMFALPVDFAGSWFFWSSAVIIISWFCMMHSGLLLLEANLNYPIGSSFNTITKDLIGNVWNVVSGLTVAFVLYILTYAYISANGAILSETVFIKTNYSIDAKIFGVCVTIFVAYILWFSSIATSRIASFFFGIKIIAFVIVFGSLFFQVDFTILRDISINQEVKTNENYFIYIFMAIPVCLASFGFHGNISSLIISYKKNNKKIIKSIVYGSLLALVIYLFWLYCTMGNVPREEFKSIIASGGNIDALVKSLIGANQSVIIKICLFVFFNLAVASSFFGVTLGLFDYLADLFKIDNSHFGRFKTVLLTFLPPCIIYLIFPNGFRHAIGAAGLCASIWAVIVPAILALKSRQKFKDQTFTVWGGKTIPIIVILFGILVIICWFGSVFNLIPKFS